MKKRVNSEKKNQSLNKRIKLTQIKTTLEAKWLRTKSEKINKMIVFLSILVVLITVIGMFFSVKEITSSSVAVDQELLRAMQYEQLDEEDETIEATENVKFSAFFLRDLDDDGYAEKINGTCKEIGTSDTLYMSLNVMTEGILKNGKIQILGENMYFQTALIEDETIKENYVSNNTSIMYLKDVGVGTQKLIFGSVRSGDYTDKYKKYAAIGNDITDYSKVNKVKLTGTYVAEDGTETQIEKIVEFTVDWYQTPTAEIPYKYAGETKNKAQNYSTNNIVDAINQTVSFPFKIAIQETENLQSLSKGYIEGEIPQFNGYDPIEVEVTGTNVSYNYDEETRIFTACREAKLSESGNIISQAYTGQYQTNRYTVFDVTVTYPLEAYETIGINTINLNVPVRAYYEAFNNPNEEFENPVKSNIVEDIISIVYERGGGDTIGFDVKVGKYVANPYDAWVISKQTAETIYNGQEIENSEDTYNVIWTVSRGADGIIDNIKLSETPENYGDKLVTAQNEYIEMEEFIRNKGIYFYGASNMFGDEGYVRVYDDVTGELLKEFTSIDWDTYTESNPYLYEQDVRHIRIETSAANANTSIVIYNIKEIDNEKITTKFSEAEFENLKLIFSYLSGYVKHNGTDEYTAAKNDQDKANYDSMLSIATIDSISPNYYSTQETKENAKITISTKKLDYNTVGWVNGEFLLKFPKEVLQLEINDVTTNNAEVTVLGYSLDEYEDGYQLRIFTENENPEVYTIIVDCNLTPDPRELTSNKNIELYAINGLGGKYKNQVEDIYDVNLDENLTERVGKDTEGIQFVGPTSIITMESAKEYNDSGEITIAPQIATIDKSEEKQTAKIVAGIRNNYSGNISGIKIVGKIPYEGNTFQLNGKELGSTFTASLIGEIAIPEELEYIATVYYSENEEVTEDLGIETNNWKLAEEVTDFSTVKSYMIDLGTYTMSKGEEREFVYEVELPEGLNYNEIAYTAHAIHFYLETEEGKLLDRTETNKLGLMIAKKFNIQIEKQKESSDVTLKGAVYKITEEDGSNSKILVTNSKGQLTFKNLYVERTYIIEELRAPENYEKSEEKLKVRGTVNDEGELVIEVLEGSYESKVEVEGQSLKTEKIVLENKPKVILKVLKKDEKGSILENVRFTATGKGFENGRTLITNSTGTATLESLFVGEIYSIIETKAEGYYIPENPTEFKVVKNDNGYGIEIVNETDDSIKFTNIMVSENENYIPVVMIEVINEKIPTFNLEVLKVDGQDETKVLSKAQFSLKQLDSGKEEYYTTTEDGKIQVGGLYQYVERRSILGEYELTETAAPEGYVTDNTKYHFRVVKELDETKVEFLNENIFEYTVEENTVKITIRNSPIFSLTKIDGVTQEPLPNTKFAIWEIDEEYNEYQVFDMQWNLVGETQEINGVTYQVITTNEEGKITIDLPTGLYKVTEIEALADYVLPEAVEDRTYYFGIGESLPGSKEWTLDKYDCFTEEKGSEEGILSLMGYYDTDDGGRLKVGMLFGDLYIAEEFTVDGNEYFVEKGCNNIIIIKYNADDKIEWIKTLEGEGNNYKYIYDNSFKNGVLVFTVEANELNYNYKENGVLKEKITLTDESYYYKTFIMRIDINTDEYKYKQVFGDFYIFECSDTNDDGTVGVTIEYENSKQKPVTIKNNKTNEDFMIEGDGSAEQAIIGLDKDLDPIWGYNISASGNNWSEEIAITPDGGYLAIGDFWNPITITAENNVTMQDIVLKSHGAYDLCLIKFNKDGKVEDTFVFGSNTGRDYAYECVALKDGAYLITGRSNGQSITVAAEDTVKNEDITVTNTKGDYAGFMFKLTTDLKVEWLEIYDIVISQLGVGKNGDIVFNAYGVEDIEEISGRNTVSGESISIPEKIETTYIVCHSNDSGKIKNIYPANYGYVYYINEEYVISPNYVSTYDAHILYEKEVEPDITQLQELVVENEKKSFLITTTASDGGTITANNVKPYYEKVAINENSKKDIIVTPDEGYFIESITINGKEISFEPNEVGSYTLEKFNNVTENKHIEVEFSEKDYLLTINKVDEKNNCIPETKFEIIKRFEDEEIFDISIAGEPVMTEGIPGFTKESEGVYSSDITLENNKYATVDIPINLTDYKDKYEIKIMTKILGTNLQNDYATIQLCNGEGNNITYKYINSNMINEEIETVFILEGGNDYILKFTYQKKTDTLDAQMVNTVTVNHLQEKWEVVTNGNGQAYQNLPIGTYDIKEIEAVDGYILNDEVRTFELNDENNKAELTVVNTKIKVPTVATKHILLGTDEQIADEETQTGDVEDSYTTAPKLDVEGYEIIKNKDYYTEEELENFGINGDDLYIPENASGKFTDEIQEVTYYYKKKAAKLIVNYYNEGTEEPVSEQGYEQELGHNEEYQTEEATDIEEKYELVETPANASGTITEDTVVNYYYQVKKFNVTTKVEKHIETNKLGIESEVAGGSILGETEHIYETVEHGEDSTKDIIATPDEGYYVQSLTVNSKAVNFTPVEGGAVILDNFVDMKEDKDVVVGFAREEGKVIVHHYIDGTTEKVPSNIEGEVVEDVIKQGEIGASYATKPSENIALYYECVGNTEPTSATYTKEDQEVTYYYDFKELEYKVEYYYGGVLDSSKTETGVGIYGDVIDTYTENEESGYKFDKVENLPLTLDVDEELNVIKVYYEPKDTQIVVKYVDKHTNEEIAEEKVISGKVFEEHDLTEDIIEIENYTLFENPEPAIVEFEDEVKTYYIYYAANTKVIVNHIDKSDDIVLESMEISGKVGDEYTATQKDFEGYVIDTKPKNETVVMTKEEIVLNYYYVYISDDVVEKHIDINGRELLDIIIHTGAEGEVYTTEAKEFEGYEIITNERYYKEFLEEQFTDEEIEDLIQEYKVETKEELFEKYEEELVFDALEENNLASDDEYIPENSVGIITKEPIEVRYYYIRKSVVKVEHINKTTNEIITEEIQVDSDSDGEYDSTVEKELVEYIEGFEGDEYQTEPKEIEGYIIAKDEEENDICPENAEGVMTKEEIVVKYYYVKESKVIERHINNFTGELIESETVHNGYTGKEYDIQSKEFDRYDLVVDKNPTNSSGQMTDENIIVEYYYVYNSKVTVEYIDKHTGEKLYEIVNIDTDGDGIADKEESKLSTVEFVGYEGDSYKSEEKEFNKYKIYEVEYPNNAEGTMTKEDIVVIYYYVYESAGVREEHRDAITGKLLEDPKIYDGYEGDSYNIASKEFEGYVLLEARIPNNASGTMTKEETIVKYYYAKKAKVIVKYVEKDTDKEVAEQVIIDGYQGKDYTTDEKRIDGYELNSFTTNNKGTMAIDDIVVTYYYTEKPAIEATPNEPEGTTNQNTTVIHPLPEETTNTDDSNSNVECNTNNTETPATGDAKTLIYAGIIGLAVIANNTILVILHKKKQKKIIK